LCRKFPVSRRSRWQTEMAEVMDARWRHHGGEAVVQFERRQDLRASALVGIVLMYGGVWRTVLGRALREASPPLRPA
jgi:hypothetical protein